MVTIALDEQGEFEFLPDVARKRKEKKDKPVFIGGILYHDDDGMEESADYNYEKERLFSYFLKVCESVGARFPQDLHFHNYTESEQEKNGTAEADNREVVIKIKEKVRNTLPEFLQDGTWDKKPLITPARKGRYYIFSLLKSREGKPELLKDGISDLANEDFAGNLYLHMAEDIVERLIFHNPYIPQIQKIHIDLATRRVVLKEKDLDGDGFSEAPRKELEFFKLGYYEGSSYNVRKEEAARKEGESEWKYLSIPLTNANNYLTAIEREMLDTGKNNIILDQLFVKPIYYGDYGKQKETAAEKNDRDSLYQKYKDYLFLYLADFICSYLGFRLQPLSSGKQIQIFSQRMEELSGNKDYLLFSYDSIDSMFKKAWIYLEERDYYKALSVAFDAMHSDSKVTLFYKHVWFSLLEDRLCGQTDLSAYAMALHKLQESVKNNNLIQEKLLYIFEHLSKMEKNVEYFSVEDKSVLFELYDTGVSAYTHVGNPEMALQYYQKCGQYVSHVGIERYLSTQNKMVVFLTDQFLYEEALKAAEENVVYHELLLQMKNEILKNESESLLSYGKALSQAGQACAYVRSEKAVEYFNKALEHFDENGANFYISLSYLLHHYIDMGMQEEYEKISVKYFGGQVSLEQQLRYLIMEGSKEKNARISMKFAMFVFIKALYVFYSREMSSELYMHITHIEKFLVKLNPDAKKQINGYPWNLIYKYIAFLACKKGSYDLAEKYVQKSEEILEKPGDTLCKINALTQVEYKRLLGEWDPKDEKDSLMETLTYMHR